MRHPANDARIWTYMPAKAYGVHYDVWFEDFLTKQLNGSQLTYVIRRLQDKQLLGSRAYYDIELRHKKLEIGYGWLNPSVWGMRYNHESLLLLFQNAFEEWKRNRVQIATDPRNIKNYNTLKN
ncbi:MAG: GNAT family N-acetyltransferase [Legionella sp.]